MNFYPHHIGDFNNATRHLSRIERSIYRDLIELYYDTELPLTLDLKALCRKVLARTGEESTAVEQVLNEFFTKTAHGWHHARCEQEISEYRASISAKSAAGKASAAKREAERLARLEELNGRSTADEQVLESADSSVQLTKNQEPLTKNQEPRTKAAPDSELFAGIAEQVVSDFKAMRKTQKAPITQTSIDGIRREASKAGMSLEDALKMCCERSWRGFKADWVAGSQQARGSPSGRSEKFDPVAHVNRNRVTP